MESRAKGKVALNNASEKAKSVFSEIKTNFKADEGAEGIKKYKSMFANLWKSGTTGKAALVAASIVVLLLFKSIFFGGSSEVGEGFEDSKPANVDTLVIKGLYMRQPVEEAAEACRKIASSQSGLVAIDHHKGIEWDQKSPEFAEAMKKYEQWVETAKREVVLEADYYAYMDKRETLWRQKMSGTKIDETDIDKKYPNLTLEEYKNKYSKTCKPERADAKKVEEWLKKHNHFKPSKYKEAPQNLIEIVAKNVGPEKEDERICAVWLYKDDHTVCQVVVTERGMARIFNAGDLSTKEFAQALVKNYPDIPSLEADVKISNEASDGLMRLKTYTWTYKDPRGFQVKILDSAYYDHHGQKIGMKAMSKANSEIAIGAAFLAGDEKKWFSITAIKPESARKFD